MLSYPITGVREGTLQAERDGLYWNVSAVCSKDWDFPIRLIAETDGARTVLGVPQPEPDGLRLRARLSNRSCPFSGQTRILTDQTPEPEPEPEPEQPEKKSSGGLLVIVLLLALAGGGAFAYVKFIKPKQGVKVSADPDDYDFEDEEYLTEDESGDIKDN